MSRLHEIAAKPPTRQKKPPIKEVTAEGKEGAATKGLHLSPATHYTRDFSSCPRCGKPLTATQAINGTDSLHWKTCSNWSCNTYVNTFIPMPHQLAVHRAREKIVGNFGGYGTGKTAATREDLIKHLLITPNANALVGANVASQYEQTLQRDFDATFPKDFVANQSIQKNFIDLHNGARLLYRPFDDAGKLRSYNLSYFVIIEASEVDNEAFVQLRARLRNDAAINGMYDWRKGIIESNPDSGWIKSDILDNAHRISFFGSSYQNVVQDERKLDPTIASVVASSSVNKYLPKNFILENARNKPQWWVDKFLNSSFMFSEGLVYPTALTQVIKAFEIPKHWRRMVAFDYGLHDDAVWLFAAIDEREGMVYIYKELRTNNADIDELADLYKDGASDILQGAMLGPVIADPKSLTKRDYSKRSLSDLFIQKGILMKPGAVSVDARVMRLNSYLLANKVKILDTCTGLIEELRNYKFPERQLVRKASSFWNKPVDKNNHAINPLEWIVMELPDDPRQITLGVYNKYGRAADDIDQLRELQWLPHALQDDARDVTAEESFMEASTVYSVF